MHIFKVRSQNLGREANAAYAESEKWAMSDALAWFYNTANGGPH